MAHASCSDEQIVDAMVALAGVAKSHRIIVTGADAYDVYLDLLRRGFSRAVTTVTCRIPCGQHDVALVAGQHSIDALELLLARIIPYLTTHARVAVWIDTQEPRPGGKIRSLLERLGFRVEAGARCRKGFVLSARRRELDGFAQAA